jgi:plastocyanin
MRRLRIVGVATALTMGASAGVALADQTIYAGPPNQFIGGDIAINQGDKVSFTNLDTAGHNVTAKQKEPGGKPLFASASASTGTSQPVVGTEYLRTGPYEYYCSIHPWMTGTITVTSNGTPAQRPGTGGSGASPSSPSKSRKTTHKRHGHKPRRHRSKRHK